MQDSYKRLEQCRVSGSGNLISALHLCEQELTGVRLHLGETLPRGPLEPIWGREELMGLGAVRPFRELEDRVFRHRGDFVRLLQAHEPDGKKTPGCGASTKGNVALQSNGLMSPEAAPIAGVNPEKFRRVTPIAHIPILSEAESIMDPVVLTWRSKVDSLQHNQEHIARDGE